MFYPNAIASAAASLIVAAGCPAIFMVPETDALPAVMLPVVLIADVVLSALTTLPLKLNPVAFMLPPVILPVAVITPPVAMLAPVTLPPALKIPLV
jgi:fumarate reductase subunit C